MPVPPPPSGRGPVLLAATFVSAVLAVGACGDDGGGADPVAFCDRLDRLARNDPFDAFGSEAGPEEIHAGFTALRERARELAAVAPEVVRPTARQYAEAVAAMDSLMAGAGYDGAVLDVDAYRVEQEQYAEASRLLLRHLGTEC
jgi:hypothetical protein